MRILLTGSHGFVGKAVAQKLTPGHELTFFSHKSDLTSIEKVDAIIHLAGENIASRWTKAKKLRIKESRCDFTKKLVASLIEQDKVPKIFLSASAVGFYGDCCEQVVEESAEKGKGFLPDVCKCWEAASTPLSEKGCRVVHMRFGMVLSKEGGVLKKMLLPFKLGLGGRIGSGKQYISWIALNDLVNAVEFVLSHENLKGPINFTAPEAVSNREFSRRLANSLDRPLGPPLPAFMARLIFGEMANELLLASIRAYPKKLLDSGFAFENSTLEF